MDWKYEFYSLVLKTSERSAENKVISSRSRVISSIICTFTNTKEMYKTRFTTPSLRKIVNKTIIYLFVCLFVYVVFSNRTGSQTELD